LLEDVMQGGRVALRRHNRVHHRETVASIRQHADVC
jgi:hypothetical protein